MIPLATGPVRYTDTLVGQTRLASATTILGVVTTSTKLSIILPAKNEATPLRRLLPLLRARHPEAEIVVVDDGSDDDTQSVATSNAAVCVRHPYSKGNGAAIKTGVKAASGDYLVMMDADGQHDPDDIARLLDELDAGYDMVVGARNFGSQANVWRGLANSFYNGLSSLITGQKILDLTSGFRAVRADRIRQFLTLLPNGFSYPSTLTMAFFRVGYNVAYVPIRAGKREGTSHLHPLRDGVRFLLIIFRMTTLYSPLKIFVPIATSLASIGIFYYAYTYLTQGRFTNMGVTLMVSSLIIFLIGLVSEQITTLLYARLAERD